MVGTEYEFLFVDVGMNGRNSDLGKLVSEQFEEWFREKHIEFVRSNTPPWWKLSFTVRVYERWYLSSNCVHDETLSSKKPEFKEAYIQLPTFKNETHIRKRIWRPR